MADNWTSIRVRESTRAALNAEVIRLDSLWKDRKVKRFWGRGHLSLDKLVLNLLMRDVKERLRKKGYNENKDAIDFRTLEEMQQQAE